MWRGLYTAATGMISEMKRTDVISNNISNAANAGYKRDVAVHKEFHPMFIKRVNDFNEGSLLGVKGTPLGTMSKLGTSKSDVTQIKGFSANPFYRPGIGELGVGDYIDEIAVDYQQGALESTGNTFDLAISGDGFFAVQTPDGVRYSRNGAFFKNTQGYLQDIRGYNLLDAQGNPVRIPDNVPDSQVIITGEGVISIPGTETRLDPETNRLTSSGNMDNRQQLTQIQFVEFGDRLATQKQGDNLYYLVNDNEGNEPLARPIAQNMQAQIINPNLEPLPANAGNQPMQIIRQNIRAQMNQNVQPPAELANEINLPAELNPVEEQNLMQNLQAQSTLQARIMNPDFQPRPASGEILQGALEKSNTAIVSEMVELIHNHRMYEANAKAVQTQDSMLDTSVNQVGSVS